MQRLIQSLTLILFTCFSFSAPAQKKNDTEFQKGFIVLLKVNNGFVTNFHSAPDLYTGGLGLNPQVTAIEHCLRLGANAGFAYTNKKFSGLFGPMAALKIKNFDLKNLAGLANLQLIAEANWGTDKQQMAGGGLGLEILQKLQLNFTAQRDYNLNSWWLQVHIGLQLNKKKIPADEFNTPRHN
ncbi:MAG: hypothetical protein ABJA37_12805 [Ferruginibacter sp.]